jgi:hypothetical protein
LRGLHVPFTQSKIALPVFWSTGTRFQVVFNFLAHFCQPRVAAQ